MEVACELNVPHEGLKNAETERCSSKSLTVLDSRTGAEYSLDISESGTLNMQSLKQIKAGGDGVGLCVYDPGYTCAAAAASRISYFDVAQGILTYRGYPIQELTGCCSYEEVVYLLVYGDLPDSGSPLANGLAVHGPVLSQ